LLRSDDFTWVVPDDVKAMQQLLLPRGESLWPEISKLSRDAHALVLAISTNPDAPSNELRLDVIESIYDDGGRSDPEFTEEDLSISMKEAKAKFDSETLKKWKKARKKADRN